MDQNYRVQRQQHPRETANVLSQFTFLYTRKLFTRGFRKDLEDDDLYEVIKACQSKKVADKLEHSYQAEQKKSNPSIFKVLWKTYGITYLCIGLLNLTFKLISSTLEPYAIAQLVSYFKPGQTQRTLNDACYYASILLGVKFLHTIYFPNYVLYLIRLAIQVKTSFSSLIYRKALKLSPRSMEKTSLGNIVTIICKDVQQFEGSIWLLNDLWIGIIQTLYICYLIYAKIGPSSTLGVLILACALPLQYYVAKIIKNLRAKLNSRTDERLQETQEVLSTMRIIKMYTWEKIFADRIDNTRRKEVKTLFIKSLARCGLMVTSDLMAKIGFYVIVMLYIYFNTTGIAAETIFYVMKSYSTLRQQIVAIFTFGLTLVAELLASLQRIGVLLDLEEIPEFIDKPDDEPQIDIRDVSTNLKDKDILKNINLKLDVGLNVVTGQLGGGKSSLIKMILRDYPIDSGELRTRGRKSYSSQDPWLFPGSIKQNILFGEKYDYERYNKIVEVCALTYDFSILEKGDETIVQDSGMNLSKGQQARINLARAIYRDSDIYLIDDALTALDTQVQEHIFKHCIEEFLEGKLVVLVTHNAKHIERSNKVIVLESGCIKYVGDQQGLSKEILQALDENPPETEEQEVKPKSVDTETDKLLPSTPKKQIYHEVKKSGGVEFEVYSKYIKYGGGILLIFSLIAFYVTATFTDSSAQIMLTNWVNQESASSSLKETHFGNSTINLDQLYSIYFHNQTANISKTASKVSNLMDQTVRLPGSITSPEHIISGLPVEHPNYNLTDTYSILNQSALTESQNKTYHILLEIEKTEHLATKYLNLYSILLISSIVFEFLKQYAVFKFGTNASINLHKSMISSVIYGKMSFFDTFLIGNILNRFSQDLSVIDEHLPMLLSMLIQAAFGFFGILGMMGHVNWKFIVAAFVVLIILVLLRFIYMPAARSLKRLEAATRSPIVGHINSSLEGLTTIRAFKAQEILKNEFDKHQDLYTSAKYTSVCAKNALMFYMDVIAVLFYLYVIARFLFFETETLAGDVGLTLTSAGALTMVLQFGLMQLAEVENVMTSVERVMEYTKIEPENPSGLEPPNWPSSGEIVYSNVSLKYTNSNDKVLDNINFNIRPGERIGVAGRTGAGKSSIIATLFRLYNHDGTVLIDGVDTKTLALKYLRTHISIIPQDPIMFSGTIRTNIDPFKEFSDEEIWKVLHKVNLDTKVANLETQVEDTNFSSGERQLLSLARAIVRKNKIVVLDEATANMDPETEQMVQKTIDANFSHCTVFIIAHRLDCILSCNKVMVLSRGKIVELDEPTVLLKDENSQFSKMMKNASNSH